MGGTVDQTPAQDKSDGPFVLTPLGAAVAEALPDRKALARVKATFKRTGRCPTSCIFPTAASVERFYQEYPQAAAAARGGSRALVIATLRVTPGRRSGRKERKR